MEKEKSMESEAVYSIDLREGFWGSIYEYDKCFEMIITMQDNTDTTITPDKVFTVERKTFYSFPEAQQFIDEWNNKRYTVRTYEVYTDHTGKLDVRGSSRDNLTLKFPTLEAAQALCKQLNIEDYEIIDLHQQNSTKEVVFESERLLKIDERENNEAKEYDAEQLEKVKRINELPVTFPLKKYRIAGKNIVLYVTRYTAEYKPSFSRAVKCPVSFRCNIEDNEESWLWIDRYFSSNHRFLKDKLIRDLVRYFFGITTYGRNKKPVDKTHLEAVSLLVNDWVELKKMYDDIVKKCS